MTSALRAALYTELSPHVAFAVHLLRSLAFALTVRLLCP